MIQRCCRRLLHEQWDYSVFEILRKKSNSSRLHLCCCNKPASRMTSLCRLTVVITSMALVHPQECFLECISKLSITTWHGKLLAKRVFHCETRKFTPRRATPNCSAGLWSTWNPPTVRIRNIEISKGFEYRHFSNLELEKRAGSDMWD